MSIRVILRGMLRLILVDTLRRVQNVGFLAARLKCFTRSRMLTLCGSPDLQTSKAIWQKEQLIIMNIMIMFAFNKLLSKVHLLRASISCL